MENWYKKATNPLNSSEDDDLLEFFDRDPWVPVNSSFIEALAYYNMAGVLEVKLKNGKVYTFIGVPQNIYESFLESPSKGAFFNNIIRQNYTKP